MQLFRPEVAERRRTSVRPVLQLSQPHGSWRALGSLLALIGLLLVVASLFQYPRAVALTGNLVAIAPPAEVRAPRAGVVGALYVSEGSSVRAGQPLARMDVEQGRDGLGSVTDMALVALRQRRALVASELARSSPDGRGELASLSAARRAMAGQLTELERQIATVQRITALSQESLSAVQALINSGFISRAEVARREQEVLAQQLQEQSLRQQRSAVAGQLAELESRIAQLRRSQGERGTELAGILADLDAQIARASEGRPIVVTAPISGQVSAVRTAVGQPASAEAVLLSVVPSSSSLEAEIHASPANLADLREGQQVELEFEGYPASTHGTMAGVLRSISRTSVAARDEDSEAAERVYVLRVALRLAVRPPSLPAGALVEGLAVRAKVIVRRRSLAQLLLDTLGRR